YLLQVAELIAGQNVVELGAQNLDYHDAGAYTGEISGSMVRDVGCSHVIVGHSERRAYYGETNAIVAHKVGAALEAGLTPILCVGETLDERESDRAREVIASQVDAVVAALGVETFSRLIVAYEPVWAIGTGKTATPEQAQEAHDFIRSRLAEGNESVAANVRILYGGSVKPDNAAALFANRDIDGGLIGGASLNADDFLAICNAAG
ncbi:MAG: triose-phosphate isomerase, partial [Proteobacteria bacterium]